jgi:hypothetical protein
VKEVRSQKLEDRSQKEVRTQRLELRASNFLLASVFLLLNCAQPLSNVSGCREPSLDLLREQHRAVEAHVEHTPVAFDQFNRQTRFPLQRSFQPGSLGQVVSTDAVFDGQSHRLILIPSGAIIRPFL